MTDEEIKALHDKAAKTEELEKQLEAERTEKKEIIAKRDAAKAEKTLTETRLKELEDKVKLTESEKLELSKLVDAEKAKFQEIETSTKAELLDSLDDDNKKLAEKLPLMDLREYCKLHGKKQAPGFGGKPNGGNNEKPKTFSDARAAYEKTN